MSCVLALQGRAFDVDSFVTKSNLPLPYRIKRKGEPRWPHLPTSSVMSFSVLTAVTSQADNIEQQIADTIEYLEQHSEYLKHLAETVDLEFATLNFGIDLRIDRKKVLTQSERFPAKLLLLAGTLGLDIELSLYPRDFDDLVGRRAEKGARKRSRYR